MSKYFLFLLAVFLLLLSCQEDTELDPTFYHCVPHADNNNQHPQAKELQSLIQSIVKAGVPGMMLSVHDELHGYWSGAYGVADLRSAVIIQPCQMTRVGSTVKTFTAVVIMLLQEEGLLSIDDLITVYLSDDDLLGIKNSQLVTIRQLLHHSSGIYNYILNAKFQTASLNDLKKVWQPEELLAYARGKEPYFAPGQDVRYSNTNYVLLGMIIEKVLGQPLHQIFRDKIFRPLELSATRFAAQDPVPPGIIRGYVDFYSNLNLINATYYSGWDYYTADGGLISNAHDLNKFLTQLFQGKILQDKSLQDMLTWRLPVENDPENFKTYYGLGLFKIETDYRDAYIHSGDAIGYYASMVYFPAQKRTISWAVNANYGRIDQYTQTKEAMHRIFDVILD